MVPCAGRFFDWEVFHFSQIVGSFDLLRMWLLVLDVIAARVIPVTGSGMFLRLVIATVQSSEGENKHMCVRLSLAEQAYLRTVWCLPRVQACTMLGLGCTSYAPHGHFWSSALYGNTFGIISHNYCLSRLFKGMSNSLWLWVGPRSWLANFWWYRGCKYYATNGRYEFLTTSIAEDFITWTSKSSLTSWRWQLDWAVFQ